MHSVVSIAGAVTSGAVASPLFSAGSRMAWMPIVGRHPVATETASCFPPAAASATAAAGAALEPFTAREEPAAAVGRDNRARRLDVSGSRGESGSGT